MNLEDVQKLTKYQVRFLNLEGGASQQKDIYKAKINEYGQRLAKSGVNVDRLINTIQRGGDPLAELRAQQEAAMAALAELEAVDDAGIVSKLDEVRGSADQAVQKFHELAERSKQADGQTAKVQADYAALGAEYTQYQEQSKRMLEEIVAKQRDVFSKKGEANKALVGKVADVNKYVLDLFDTKNLAFFTFAARVKGFHSKGGNPSDEELVGEAKALGTIGGGKDEIITQLKESSHYRDLTEEQRVIADKIFEKMH